MPDRDEDIDETKREPSKTGSTAIKYGAYIVITIIILYFLARFIKKGRKTPMPLG